MADHVSRCRRIAAVAFALVLALAAGGCGVSASSEPEDIGDALVAGGNPGNEQVRLLPQPNVATSPEALVRSYLKAGSGGGDDAVKNVKSFLDKKALQSWHPPTKSQQLTVIRLVGDLVPGATSGDRTPVTVNYQVVGVLNEQGSIEALTELVTRKMVFQVVPDESNNTILRVDEIAGVDQPPPAGLMITDDLEYYRPQPIYFWDQAGKALIPDVRYLPLTLQRDARLSMIVQWLVSGPSSWLSTAPARLPGNTGMKGGVVTRGDTVVVNLNAAAVATPGGPDSIQHLYYQLQWSLLGGLTTPPLELQIEDKAEVTGPAASYLPFDQTDGLNRVDKTKFDIVDNKVIAVPANGSQPDVLKSPLNQSVNSAAVDRSGNLAAFVRTGGDGRRFLQIARGPTSKVDGDVPRSKVMGRPVWIPGMDALLVPSGGRLYLVGADGKSTDVTVDPIAGVTAVSVSPDGRRLAVVANGQAFVTSLGLDGTSVTVGSSPRQILAKQLAVSAIAWTNEIWVYVVGTSNGKPALWRSTADGVMAVAIDLKQVAPSDVVALPLTSARAQSFDVLLHTTTQGTFRYLNSPIQDADLKAPFFVS
jgi:hypothetical protein